MARPGHWCHLKRQKVFYPLTYLLHVWQPPFRKYMLTEALNSSYSGHVTTSMYQKGLWLLQVNSM